MALKSLIKIDLNDRQDIFLICNYIPAQNLTIILLDLNECKAFSGSATDIDLRSQAATLNMTFSDFVSLTKKALIQNEPDEEQFLYRLEKNCAGFLFQWKSIDQEETVINIGSVKVIEGNYESTIKNVFMELSEEMFTLNMKVLNMETELSNVKKQKEEALHQLSDVADMKKRVEKELYSKFLLVLNEKKQKITELKLRTDKLENNVSSDLGKKKVSRTKVLHQISESSDEIASDIESMDVAGPSTSKRNSSLLFLDDDEPDLSKISPPKRRIRNKIVVSKLQNLQKPKSRIKNIIESESEDELLNNF